MATPAEIVSALQGLGATQGWDVVVALTAARVNELFRRQFVLDLALGDDLPPVSGSVPVIDNDSVEFVSVTLGSPLIAFDPALDPQEAILTIPVISGLAHTVLSFAGVKTVRSTQWITASDGYTITGTVPLATVTGKVDKNHTDVVLQIKDGKAFVADLNLPGAAQTTLGKYFLTFLQAHADNFDYKLGTLSYTPNQTDLVPAATFQIATQRDASDPADAGRILLFVPTQYAPGGGTQTVLPLANVVPAGLDVTLLVASRVVFGSIVKDAVAATLKPYGATVGTAGTAGRAWSVSITGGQLNAGAADVRDGQGGRYYTGSCWGDPAAVFVPLAGIGFGSAAGQISASWSGTWTQHWAHSYPAGRTGLCDDGSVDMTVTLGAAYQPSVNEKSVITFAAKGGIDVSFSNAQTARTFFGSQSMSDTAGSVVKDYTSNAVSGLLTFALPQVGAFAVTNLLFPQEDTVQLASVYVPGDLVAFGTLKATALAVSPALATITTGEQQAFTATAPVTWSASTGTITADGHYSPPATVAGSQVVIITATATTATYETTPAAGDLGRAYAAVIVTQPHVQVAPLIKVFTAGDAAQQFFASAPGTAGQQTTWSLSGKVGTLASDGTYTPPDSVAMPTVVFLTGRIGTQMGQATIIVFPQFLTGIAVTPNATTPLVPGATQAFTATTKGKTADVTWTLLPEIGKITVDGHYTAPGTAQAKVTVPTPVLVVAQDRHDETSGGTAVILLAPSAG